MPFIRMEGAWEDLGGPAGGGAGEQETPGKTGFETSHSWLVLFLCFRKPGGLAGSAKLGCIFGFCVERERGIKKRKYHFLNY